MRSASVYLRRGCYFIQSEWYTTAGVGILSGPAIAVFEEGGLNEDGLAILGQAIVSALDGSRCDVPHPTDWKAVPSSMPPLAGVKSWRAFEKLATSIEVAEDEAGPIVLTPNVYLGPREGYESVPSKRVRVTREDPTLLGKLAVKLLGEAAGR